MGAYFDDDIMTTGDYYIEQDYNGQWNKLTRDESHLDESLKYEVTRLDSQLYSYSAGMDGSTFEQGDYRIGIDYKRKSLYGIELDVDASPIYRVYDDFYIGQDNIAKDTKSNNDENSIEGIVILSEYEVYEQGTEIVKVKLYNYLNDPFTYGEGYSIERLIDSQWEPLRGKGDRSFVDIGYSLEPMSEHWMSYNLEFLYDDLEEGQYRIHTNILRDSIDGKDFGPGNYPSYDIYCYFEIGKDNIIRELETFYKDMYEYKNSEYGFGMLLPIDWEDLLIINEPQDVTSPMHDILLKIDANYSIIRLQHPLNDSGEYQDFVFAIVDRYLWNTNVEKAVEGDWDSLPKIIDVRNDLFIVDPYQYDESLKRYEEVMTIIEEGMIQY